MTIEIVKNFKHYPGMLEALPVLIVFLFFLVMIVDHLLTAYVVNNSLDLVVGYGSLIFSVKIIFYNCNSFRYIPINVNFSARTSAQQTQDIIMGKLDRYSSLSTNNKQACCGNLSRLLEILTASLPSLLTKGGICLVHK